MPKIGYVSAIVAGMPRIWCARHAEVVRLRFDSAVISYQDLLEMFCIIHDPTTVNCQGSDVGTQYLSVIYFQSAQQEIVACKV